MTRTTPTEHTLLNSDGDTVKRGLAVATRAEVFRGIVDSIQQDSATHGIYSLTLNTITGGDPTNCLPGMSLDIGTTPGARDIGTVRIRYWNSTTTIVTVAETAPADLPVEVGHYVTARKEFLPWSIPKRVVLTRDGSGNITAVTEYLDYDLAYSSGVYPYFPKGNISAGHNADGSVKPVEPFGWEDTPGCGYRTVHLSALDSVMHNPGATLTTTVWYTEDGTILGGLTSLDPEFDLQIPVGFRYIHLFIQDSFGAQDILFRHFPLWCDSRAAPQFVLENFNVTSDETEAGRELQLEFFGDANEADESVLPVKSLVCYFEKPEWNGGTTPPDSYRMQVMGWVTDDEPLLKLNTSTYGIRIGSTQHWKQMFRANSITFTDTGSTPTTYTEVQNFTVDRALDFSLIATDTLRSLVNVYYSGVTSEVSTLTLPLGDAWTQLTETAPRAAMSGVGCDSLGHIYIRRLYAYLSPGARAAIPEALSITNVDWTDENGLSLPTGNIQRAGAVNASAELWNSGDRVLYASRAPGLREGYGTAQAKLPDQYLQLPTPQADLSRLAGLHYWHENNPRPTITLVLFGNFDVIEPCWQQPVLITWTDDTIRGTQLVAVPFLVKHISIAHTNDPDESNPPKRITWTLEQATVGPPGETAPVLQMEGISQPPDTSCDTSAAFSFVVTNCSVAFTDESTGDLLFFWYWDFGDGSSPSTERNPTHIYTAPGLYAVSLIVVSACGEDYSAISHDVTIAVESVSAGFTDVPTGLSVAFTDTSSADSGVVAWAWDFGDSATATTQNPTHVYAASDTYHVTLTVTSACGNSSSVSHDVSASESVSADFTWTGTPTVSFTDTSTVSGTIASWLWHFGDGTTDTSQNPTHTYSYDSVYTVSLQVTTTHGVQDTKIQNVTVTGTGAWLYSHDFTVDDGGWLNSSAVRGFYAAGTGWVSSFNGPGGGTGIKIHCPNFTVSGHLTSMQMVFNRSTPDASKTVYRQMFQESSGFADIPTLYSVGDNMGGATGDFSISKSGYSVAYGPGSASHCVLDIGDGEVPSVGAVYTIQSVQVTGTGTYPF